MTIIIIMSIDDYRLALRSRIASVVGRREVLNGRAKFGIFGDGKEMVQLAMARSFEKGDWRSGYYRDQTLMFALGLLTVRQFFAQLYGDTDPAHEVQTGGRSMNNHFATRLLDPDGNWLDQTDRYNSAADLSPTASQMPRAVGLAYASLLYRQLGPQGPASRGFSRNGNEVVWATIGNASTAEGLFWESVNAIGVLRVPAVITVYDDGYGISVPNRFQMVKENIHAALAGFQRTSCPGETCDRGFDLYSVRGWDYPALCEIFKAASAEARQHHVPALVHVTELTQPLGHSTSGSHERYKDADRLVWEAEYDCIVQFKRYLLEQNMAVSAELEQLEAEEQAFVEQERRLAYEEYRKPILQVKEEALRVLKAAGLSADTLEAQDTPAFRDIAAALHEALLPRKANISGSEAVLAGNNPDVRPVLELYQKLEADRLKVYGSYLYAEGKRSALNITEIQPEYGENPPLRMGFEIIHDYFDAALARDRRIIAFGEDMGQLGDVNQGFHGLQEKYGALRVTDTGIREATIVGQAIGLALRGFKPIAEIQYLDYLLYGLQLLSDDLASLYWRTAGSQKAPVIIRTRGHRLEGIWHSGSPMGGILHLIRGMYLLVPRDFTRAAAFYNAMLASDDSAIIIEVLNGYRRKEPLPENLAHICLPPGVCEVLREGKDITLVTYGAAVRPVMEAADLLARCGAEAEVIDIQSLLPFDLRGMIHESLKKTSRLLVVDEDVPGGASAYMLREILEVQGGYELLDSPPRTLTAAPHRPAYGSDGDYWSKPNRETIFNGAYEILHEAMPARFPALW
ncbi:MAG: transketolase [Treponema sp.]|nr:transketolase [Treponema sp.]